MRGLGCGAAEEKNIKTYKPIYTYTKNAHWCYISPVHGGAVCQRIRMKFGTLIELTHVINFVKFGVDRSQGWGLVSRQILGFCFHWRRRPYHCITLPRML